MKWVSNFWIETSAQFSASAAKRTERSYGGRNVEKAAQSASGRPRHLWRLPADLHEAHPASLNRIKSACRLHRQVASTSSKTVLVSSDIERGQPMRTRVRKFAHVLERLGLAMAGAASGLFVAALVGTSHAALTNQAFLLLMMLGGAVGFYLGIDTPPLPFKSSIGNNPIADDSWVGRIDTPELLSAIGTFFAAFSAFASVGLIVLRHDPHLTWIGMIMAGWVVGVAMQIVAGTIARTRR